MPAFRSFSLPLSPGAQTVPDMPAGFHPDGLLSGLNFCEGGADSPPVAPSGQSDNLHPEGLLLGGLNLGGAGADIDAWANGAHTPGFPDLSGAMRGTLNNSGPEDRARGIGEALEGTKLAAEGMHGLGALTVLGAGAGRAAPIIEGLEGVNRGFVIPLTIGKGIADTFSDVHGGAPLGEAIVGNGLRSGLVLGGAALGQAIIPVPIVGGAIGGYVADQYLPRGSMMGHGIIQGMIDYPPQPLDYL